MKTKTKKYRKKTKVQKIIMYTLSLPAMRLKIIGKLMQKFQEEKNIYF